MNLDPDKLYSVSGKTLQYVLDMLQDNSTSVYAVGDDYDEYNNDDLIDAYDTLRKEIEGKNWMIPMGEGK